jgi:hypothetical protein
MDPERGAAHDQGLLFIGQGSDQLGQGHAVDELHRDVDPAIDLVDLVDPAHVGIVDPGLGPGLADDPPRHVGVIAAHELDRDVAAEPEVAGQVDPAHAALAEEADRPVAIPRRHREALDHGVGAVAVAQVEGRRGQGRVRGAQAALRALDRRAAHRLDTIADAHRARGGRRRGDQRVFDRGGHAGR